MTLPRTTVIAGLLLATLRPVPVRAQSFQTCASGIVLPWVQGGGLPTCSFGGLILSNFIFDLQPSATGPTSAPSAFQVFFLAVNNQVQLRWQPIGSQSWRIDLNAPGLPVYGWDVPFSYLAQVDPFFPTRRILGTTSTKGAIAGSSLATGPGAQAGVSFGLPTPSYGPGARTFGAPASTTTNVFAPVAPGPGVVVQDFYFLNAGTVGDINSDPSQQTAFVHVGQSAVWNSAILLNITTTPEPATVVLFATGLLMIGLIGRRRVGGRAEARSS